MELVRAALAESSFGVLTTIDLRATLEEKLGGQVPPEMILGACNPRFAYAATQALPSVAAYGTACDFRLRKRGANEARMKRERAMRRVLAGCAAR